MTEAIEYQQFDHSEAPNGASAADADLSRLSEIPMELSVEIGRTHMTVGETLDLRVGSVVTLERLAGETADLLVNGTSIARGEVVVIDEQYGLRITLILDGGSSEGDAASAGPADVSAPAGAAAAPQDSATPPAAGAEAPQPSGPEQAAGADGSTVAGA